MILSLLVSFFSIQSQQPPALENFCINYAGAHIEINYDLVHSDSEDIFIVELEYSEDEQGIIKIDSTEISGDIGIVQGGTGKSILWNASSTASRYESGFKRGYFTVTPYLVPEEQVRQYRRLEKKLRKDFLKKNKLLLKGKAKKRRFLRLEESISQRQQSEQRFLVSISENKELLDELGKEISFLDDFIYCDFDIYQHVRKNFEIPKTSKLKDFKTDKRIISKRDIINFEVGNFFKSFLNKDYTFYTVYYFRYLEKTESINKTNHSCLYGYGLKAELAIRNSSAGLGIKKFDELGGFLATNKTYVEFSFKGLGLPKKFDKYIIGLNEFSTAKEFQETMNILAAELSKNNEYEPDLLLISKSQ